MFCKNCGNEIKENAKFCSKCGTLQSASSSNLVSSINSNSEKAYQNNIAKKKIHPLAMIVLIILSVLTIALIIWLVPYLLGDLSGKGNDDAGTNYSFFGNSENQKEAIVLNDISFNTSMCSITYEFENISDKDIAYITFKTYFYDRMGGVLATEYGDDFSNLKYTGPLYSGSTDSAYWEYLFEMPSGTSVVYPRKITVTFTDDEEITFENTVYCHTDDFYGGELKDKK